MTHFTLPPTHLVIANHDSGFDAKPKGKRYDLLTCAFLSMLVLNDVWLSRGALGPELGGGVGAGFVAEGVDGVGGGVASGWLAI